MRLILGSGDFWTELLRTLIGIGAAFAAAWGPCYLGIERRAILREVARCLVLSPRGRPDSSAEEARGEHRAAA